VASAAVHIEVKSLPQEKMPLPPKLIDRKLLFI